MSFVREHGIEVVAREVGVQVAQVGLVQRFDQTAPCPFSDTNEIEPCRPSFGRNVGVHTCF